MSQPAKSVVASKNAMSSYLGVRPLSAAVFVDGTLVQAGAPGMGAIEYFTHNKQGGIINQIGPSD